MKIIDLTVRDGDTQVLKLELSTEASVQHIWETLQQLTMSEKGARTESAKSFQSKARYSGLATHLKGQEGSKVSMGFDEISALLERALPPSALDYRAWWANDLTHSQAKAWFSAGWRTADVDMASQTVVFERL